MQTMTVAHLREIAGGKAPLASKLVGPINKHAVDLGIDTPLRMAHFLCHMAHETGGFSALVESLNYDVAGLRRTFSKARVSDAQCQAMGRKSGKPADQQAIANTVYRGAWGKTNLGNTQTGDGWKFRGHRPHPKFQPKSPIEAALHKADDSIDKVIQLLRAARKCSTALLKERKCENLYVTAFIYASF